MQLNNNAAVFTADGQEAGHIDRVVLDPRTKEITDVIVRKGLLFPKDKVVPVEMIDSSSEDRVTLRHGVRDPDELPDYEETEYISLEDEDDVVATYPPDHVQPLYWYPYGLAGLHVQHPVSATQKPYVTRKEHHIPEGTVVVNEGAKVTSADGKYVGNVERVFFDPKTDHVTSFLVSKGLVLKEKMLIPAAWVIGFGEMEIKLAVGSRTLERQSRLLENLKDPDGQRRK
jgi:uncharacterized protein YrrD